MKDEAPQSLKRAETMEPSYYFNSSCQQQYHRRVLGFPARTSDSNPIVCIECNGSYIDCLLNRFKNSTQSLVSLYMV